MRYTLIPNLTKTVKSVLHGQPVVNLIDRGVILGPGVKPRSLIV
jgi:hypothetical protein